MTVEFTEKRIEYYINDKSDSAIYITTDNNDILSFLINPISGKVSGLLYDDNGGTFNQDGTAAMRANTNLTYLTFLFNDSNEPIVSNCTFEIDTTLELMARYNSERNSNNNNASPKKYVLTSNGLCQITRL